MIVMVMVAIVILMVISRKGDNGREEINSQVVQK